MNLYTCTKRTSITIYRCSCVYEPCHNKNYTLFPYHVIFSFQFMAFTLFKRLLIYILLSKSLDGVLFAAENCMSHRRSTAKSQAEHQEFIIMQTGFITCLNQMSLSMNLMLNDLICNHFSQLYHKNRAIVRKCQVHNKSTQSYQIRLDSKMCRWVKTHFYSHFAYVFFCDTVIFLYRQSSNRTFNINLRGITVKFKCKHSSILSKSFRYL